MEGNGKRKTQVYIKEGAYRDEQRAGLDLLLTMSCRGKEDGSPPDITNHVMNIAEYFLIVDETSIPPAHLLAKLLTSYAHPHMTREENSCLIQALSANTFREPPSSSRPTAELPEPSLAAKTTTPSATRLDSDTDSDAEQRPSPNLQAVDVRCDEDKLDRVVDTIQEREFSATAQVPIDEAALERKLRDNIHKLTPAILASAVKYYQAQRSTPRKEIWNAAQYRAAHLLYESIDASHHQGLKVPTAGNINATLATASFQGSLFLKSLMGYVLDAEGDATLRQAVII